MIWAVGNIDNIDKTRDTHASEPLYLKKNVVILKTKKHFQPSLFVPFFLKLLINIFALFTTVVVTH